jgi:hypothetical protein
MGAGDRADETVLDDYEERDPDAGTRPLAATPEQGRVTGPAGA